MLYLIGLGLGDERDVTLRAQEALSVCSDIYIEEYTSRFLGRLDAMGRVKRLTRAQVESNFLVDEAKTKTIAMLVCGDPLAATTHMQLLKDCKDNGVKCEVVHNASVMTAIAEAGLSLYKYGRTTTLCFPQTNWDPTSSYEIIAANRKAGLHTLVLLDTMDGKELMTCQQAHQLLTKHNAISKDELLVYCYALGTDRQKIEFSAKPTGAATPACIIVPGLLDEKEREFLGMWKMADENGLPSRFCSAYSQKMNDTDERLRKETEKWLQRAKERQENIVLMDAKNREHQEMLTNVDNYLSDAGHFLVTGKTVEAFEASVWAWAWIEIMERLGFFIVSK